MGSKYMVWIIGAAALGLGAWYVFSRGTKSEIEELAGVIRQQNEDMDKLEAVALAASQKAQEAVNQALNAAETAGVAAGASNYTSSEGNNQQAQAAASSNPTDAAAQAKNILTDIQ